MVQKLSLMIFGLIALVAVGGIILELKDTVTGQYYAGGGIGRWYGGTQRVQLQPDEACIYSGLQPLHPWRVYTNEYGSPMSLCQKGDVFVGVPVWQTVYVPQK